MGSSTSERRRDRASRVIKAPRDRIYRAFLDPASLAAWLPPANMTGRVHAFDAREGGLFRLSLTYTGPDPAWRGKTSDDTDTVRGRFVTLVPERIVQAITFESDDPAFAIPMMMTWTLAEVPGGTEVTVLAEDVPASIRPEDHAAGLRSTLANLAAFTERATKP